MMESEFSFAEVSAPYEATGMAALTSAFMLISEVLGVSQLLEVAAAAA